MRIAEWILVGSMGLGLLSCKTASFVGGGKSKDGNKNDQPLEPVTPVTPVTPIFTECPESPDRMLVAGLYTLPENQANLPDFTTLKKVKDVCLKQLDVPDHDFNEGFPGIPDLVEWFGLDINWRVNIPADGQYTFILNSDDGSTLDIDGKRVIDNDGLHPHQEASGQAQLTKGYHAFHVRYYEGPRYRIALELFWLKPGATLRTYIPTELFARPEK